MAHLQDIRTNCFPFVPDPLIQPNDVLFVALLAQAHRIITVYTNIYIIN